MSAHEFATQMWEDSDMHKRVKNTGNGACAGKGAWLCAGSYLAKLIKYGWVEKSGNWLFHITVRGEEEVALKWWSMLTHEQRWNLAINLLHHTDITDMVRFFKQNN